MNSRFLHEDGTLTDLPHWPLLCPWGDGLVFHEEGNPNNLLRVRNGRPDSLDLSSYAIFAEVNQASGLGKDLLIDTGDELITIRDSDGKMEVITVVTLIDDEYGIMPFQNGFLTRDNKGTVWYLERDRREVFCQVGEAFPYPGGGRDGCVSR